MLKSCSGRQTLLKVATTTKMLLQQSGQAYFSGTCRCYICLRAIFFMMSRVCPPFNTTFCCGCKTLNSLQHFATCSRKGRLLSKWSHDCNSQRNKVLLIIHWLRLISNFGVSGEINARARAREKISSRQKMRHEEVRRK